MWVKYYLIILLRCLGPFTGFFYCTRREKKCCSNLTMANASVHTCILALGSLKIDWFKALLNSSTYHSWLVLTTFFSLELREWSGGLLIPFRKQSRVVWIPSSFVQTGLVFFKHRWTKCIDPVLIMSLRKHAYSNIFKISPPQTENFQTKKKKKKKKWYFSYFCSKHRLWVLNRTASSRRSVHVPTIYIFREVRKIMYTPGNPSFTI